MIAVTTAALLVLLGALAIVIAKTWTSHCRGEAISINDLVAEDDHRRARAAEVEI
ncbi:hypothetical protein [Mycobacterium neglectum]|uniref:hypothetical protein n=1 Tax=Mycobacterium neglectum TaxID=242737 RepID=UPI00159BCE2B|nr:hypothetical protein [Mycobacterium neglectum]